MDKSIKDVNMNMACLIDEAIEACRKEAYKIFNSSRYSPEARLDFIQTSYVPIVNSLVASIETVTEVSRYF